MNQLVRDFRRFFPLFSMLALGVLLFAFLMGAVYPQIREQMGLLLIKVPAFLRPMVQKQLGNHSFESFIGLGYTHPLMLALFGIWAVAVGSSVAGEIERGTLGMILSYPLSRTGFLFSRMTLLFGGLALLSFLMLPAFWLAFVFFRFPHAGMGPYLWASGGNFLLYGAIAALTLWVSAASSEGGLSAKCGAALLLASFFLNYLAQFWPKVAFLRWLSFFAYFDPKFLLAGKPLSPLDLLVLGGSLLLGSIGAFWVFRKRDLSI